MGIKEKNFRILFGALAQISEKKFLIDGGLLYKMLNRFMNRWGVDEPVWEKCNARFI